MSNISNIQLNLNASFGNERSRIDYKILKSIKHNCPVFSYNGLIYTYLPKENIFVNQYMRTMEVNVAKKLASEMGYREMDLNIPENNIQ